jgi:hypothetical protein
MKSYMILAVACLSLPMTACEKSKPHTVDDMAVCTGLMAAYMESHLPFVNAVTAEFTKIDPSYQPVPYVVFDQYNSFLGLAFQGNEAHAQLLVLQGQNKGQELTKANNSREMARSLVDCDELYKKLAVK